MGPRAGSDQALTELAEGEQESLVEFQETTQRPILVSLPTDSAGLDPSAVIASTPAEAHRVAVATSVSAGVNPEEAEAAVAEAAEEGAGDLLIQQQVPLVPSQIPSSVVLTQNQESRIKVGGVCASVGGVCASVGGWVGGWVEEDGSFVCARSD